MVETATTEIDAKQFILDQFRANNVRYRELANDFSVYCPFAAHSGKKMLLQIRHDGAMIHCWSCGTSGHYNKFADKVGLKRLPASINAGYGAVDRAINDAYLERGIPALPLGLKPVKKPYRGLSLEFLKQFESQLWYDLDSLVWRILWPLRYNGKLQGYTAGRLDGETMPKYRHGPKGVVQTRRVLFPIDHRLIRETVVLVEGPYSALRLINAGIPALATLGADNWHSAKINMLQQRKYPVRGVVIAFDADPAGEHGSEKIHESIRDVFERVEVFDCPLRRVPLIDEDGQHIRDKNGRSMFKLDAAGNPILEGTDPGDMPEQYVEKLRALYEDVRASVGQKRNQASPTKPAVPKACAI